MVVEGILLISLIFTVAVSVLSIISAIIAIWQWFESRRGKKKFKTVVIFSTVFVVSLVITLFSIPEATNVVHEYKNYKEEVAAQQAEDEQRYALAQEYVNEGNMFEAIRQLQSVSSHYTSYNEVQDLLTSCIDTYKSSILAEAEELSAEGALADAINVIKTATFLLPEDSDLNLKLEKYSNDLSQNIISNALTEATSYADGGDYDAAILVIQGALNDYPENQELKLKISDYEKLYVESVLDKVSNFLSEHDVDSAVDILNEALSVLPQNNDLIQRMEVCKNITVNLSSLPYLNQSGRVDDVDTQVANDSSLIKDGFVIYGGDSSRTYAIDGNYSAIIGTFALTDESKNDDVRCILTITVDSKEYVLPEVRAGVRPIPFDIPLTNAQNITFTLYSENYWTKVVVGDTILYKN